MPLTEKLMFWKKKKEKAVEEVKEVKKEKTLLEELCEKYKAPYSFLSYLIPISSAAERNVEELEKRGREYEKVYESTKDPIKALQARMEYWSALQAAICRGDKNSIIRFAEKCASLSSGGMKEVFGYLTKEENLDKVLALTKELYEKTPPTEKKPKSTS